MSKSAKGDEADTSWYATVAQLLRQTGKYKDWCRRVLERDNFTCDVSGTKSGKLHAHHKIHLMTLVERRFCDIRHELKDDFNKAVEIAENSPEFWDINNGVTLSEIEHNRIHSHQVNDNLVVITGIYGQDASYLAEFLLKNNYEVIGIARRHSADHINSNLDNVINHPKFKMVHGDITDPHFISYQIQKLKPGYYMNLAAMSHVGQSFSEPLITLQTNSSAVVSALEAIRQSSPKTKFYQASTSEMWGAEPCPPSGFNESSKLDSRSPYATAKIAAHHMVKLYRESYNIFAVSGILCNHESPRRGLDFVTRKITNGIALIKCGKASKLQLGNLEAIRDWGHAAEYVEAMWLMMQQEKPDTYVVATGEPASVHDFLNYVCELAELDPKDVVEFDQRFMRPSDVPYLKGDASKIKALGWKPSKNWKAVAREMFESDLAIARSGK